ncbi:MAG: toxin-antitoxin system protein [Verrucomicrobiota bacterium]|nr:toxin-antitoxin system protein [Verrucomicrobiota bacterium]
MPQMVRISPAAHRSLAALAKQSNSPLQEVLEEAIENERRRVLIENANAGYSKLRSDKKAWREWKRELLQWDSTLGDGI